MPNLLFLDIDGVLNLTDNQYSDKYPEGLLSAGAVENLKEILLTVPDLKVVISSSWRHKESAIFLGYQWKAYDLPYKALLSVTGKDHTLGLDNNPRLDEINEWLDNYHYIHNRQKKYVIIDDALDDIKDEELIFPNGHICHTEYCTGLTETKKQEILDFFLKN